jgi:hypothetical protein
MQRMPPPGQRTGPDLPQLRCSRPARDKWNGWGYEYKSKSEFLGPPLLHNSFKYRPNLMPVPAKGVIAIGQFSAGIINISQFSIGLFSLSQFTESMFAIAQIGIGWSLIAQIGIYVDQGMGQLIWNLMDLPGK